MNNFISVQKLLRDAPPANVILELPLWLKETQTPHVQIKEAMIGNSSKHPAMPFDPIGVHSTIRKPGNLCLRAFYPPVKAHRECERNNWLLFGLCL